MHTAAEYRKMAEEWQIACQIVLMHPLHDQADARRLLVVGSRQQGRAVPFDDPRSHGLRHGIAKLYRIVDDDQVAAKAPIEMW